MKLVMTLLVRDEEDILETNIDYHLSQGVDFIIAMDNNSVDDTPSILRRYERKGVLKYIPQTEDNYAQSRWVTQMAALACDEYAADWIINNDADEFWWPGLGNTLKDLLAGMPEHVKALRVKRHNFVPLAVGGDDERPFWRKMVWREACSLNPLGKPLPPKVCHRAAPGLTVLQGNHEVLEKGRRVEAASSSLEIMHFPLRSYRHFENKIRKGGAAYERNSELEASVGKTWRVLFEQYKEGRLPVYYEGQAYTKEKIRQALADGSVVPDYRLQDYLSVIASFRPREGIITLADANYFEGLKLLYGSVQADYPLPMICYDLGLTESQRQWCDQRMPMLTIRPIPDEPIIEQIRQKLDGPPLAKKEKRQWPLWLCPFLIAASPFRRTFWVDSDIVVLRNLKELFRHVDEGPVFTPDNLAPEKTPNPDALYDLLPIDREFDRKRPAVNAGISGWDLVRDRALLHGYMHPVLEAMERPEVKEAIAWWDQGCLIWALQKAGMEHRVFETNAWNLCVKLTPVMGRHYQWHEGLMEELRALVPDANIIHWNGVPVPWNIVTSQ